MYALTILLFPLALPGLMAWFWDPARKPQTWRMAFRGALLAIPAMLLWLLFGFSYAPAWGSVLLAGSFLMRFWLLPFGLLAVAYGLSCGFRGLERGGDFRPLVGFSFGFLSVFNLVHAVALWGNPYFAWTLILPLLLGASGMYFPALLEETVRDGMPDGLKWIAAALGLFLLAAVSLAMLFLRQEILGAVLALGYMAGVGFLGYKRLSKRP